jgi:hypothetical protein
MAIGFCDVGIEVTQVNRPNIAVHGEILLKHLVILIHVSDLDEF